MAWRCLVGPVWGQHCGWGRVGSGLAPLSSHPGSRKQRPAPQNLTRRDGMIREGQKHPLYPWDAQKIRESHNEASNIGRVGVQAAPTWLGGCLLVSDPRASETHRRPALGAVRERGAAGAQGRQEQGPDGHIGRTQGSWWSAQYPGFGRREAWGRAGPDRHKADRIVVDKPHSSTCTCSKQQGKERKKESHRALAPSGLVKHTVRGQR